MSAWKNLVLIVVLGSLGCQKTPLPPSVSGPQPYSSLKLGMTVAEAEAVCGGKGQEMAHDELPFEPRPRDLFNKLPDDTQWLYWGNRGHAPVVLGIHDGKTILRLTHHVLNGKPETDAEADTKYQ